MYSMPGVVPQWKRRRMNWDALTAILYGLGATSAKRLADQCELL